MSSLNVSDLPLGGLKLVRRRLTADARGSFVRLFCATELAAAGWTRPVTQVNHARTAARGTVRGLHFQHEPHAEMKLVSCVRGEVWDVAVDVRRGSPTFLQWHAETLKAADGTALLIPEGYAHGFQALTDEAELVYCHSAAYCPAAEAGLHVQDMRLAIGWPLPVGVLSERDRNLPVLDDDFRGVAV